MEKNNHILVIFGASGDLTKRKLLPAILNLQKQGMLPSRFAVLGVSRSKLSDDEFRNIADDFMKNENPEVLEKFKEKLFYQPVDTSDADDYINLKNRLDKLSVKMKTGGNCIFYLSTPPALYEVIPPILSKYGLTKETDETGWKRIIVEKPFGVDLESSRKLNKLYLKHFKESQIYRIDHYLGKETVQNILVSRFSNAIYEPIWNRNYIHRVEITSSENIGVENRGGYYDNSGAMRDMVQNHLLQLVALVAMEPPASMQSDSIRNETVKVLQSLKPLSKEDIQKNVIRGQYTESHVKGELMKGYRDENNVAEGSSTETFFAMKFFIQNWRWSEVPFFVRTGKRLPTRVTEIVIHFKETPHRIFHDQCCTNNKLIIRIQPDEGLLLKYGMKVPGAGFKVQEVNMDFHYKDLNGSHQPTAYERLLLDCMQGDSTLYARKDSVEASWEFINPILEEWEENPDIKLYGYPAGTWGPQEADELMPEGHAWRYPCRNLADDGIYCEL